MKTRIFLCLALILSLTTFTGCGGDDDHSDLVVGVMSLEIAQMPADGSSAAEVVVFIYDKMAESHLPREGMEVKVISSRNQGGDEVDIIEQPNHPTDADGRAVAFVASSNTGEAMISATYDGVPLCEIWEESECVQPATATVTFTP